MLIYCYGKEDQFLSLYSEPDVFRRPDCTNRSTIISLFQEKAPKQKFPPEDLAGFQVDSFRFRSISGFDVYGNDFPLPGKMSAIKHTFGQWLDSGRVNCYLIYYSGYNALGGSIQSYANALFEKKTGSGLVYAAYPVAMRMKDKKFERVKDNLQDFFKDYPEIAEKIKTIQQHDGFFELLKLIKKPD